MCIILRIVYSVILTGIMPHLLVIAIHLKPLNRILRNLVVIKDMPVSVYDLILINFLGSYVPFELRNLANIKNTVDTFCYCKSSETTLQKFVKCCSQ